MIDERKLIEELTSLLVEFDIDLYSSGRIIGLIKNQQQIDQWIPCEERLPEECEKVLVWYEYFRYGEYNRMFQTYGIGYQVDGFWGGDVSGKKSRCIAWRPLPEAYLK